MLKLTQQGIVDALRTVFLLSEVPKIYLTEVPADFQRSSFFLDLLPWRGENIASGLRLYPITWQLVYFPPLDEAGNEDVDNLHAVAVKLGKPATVLLVVLPDDGVLADGYTALETQRFDVCAVAGLADGETAAFITWAKDAYDNKGKRALFVVAGATAPDHKAIVHFDVGDITVGAQTYTDLEYVPRIAGALAGLQLWESATYLVLPEVTDCPHLTRALANSAIAAGKLILYHDGEKVKIARGVTSLTTIGSDGNTDFHKAKVVRILNQLEKDITTNIEDNYIGKVPNTYVHKALLITAIRDYLTSLVAGTTLLKAAHMTELQTAINNVRAYYGLAAYGFTPIMAGVTGVAGWSAHVSELRVAIDEVVALVNGWDAANGTNDISLLAWITISENRPAAAIIQQLRDAIPLL